MKEKIEKVVAQIKRPFAYMAEKWSAWTEKFGRNKKGGLNALGVAMNVKAALVKAPFRFVAGSVKLMWWGATDPARAWDEVLFQVFRISNTFQVFMGVQIRTDRHGNQWKDTDGIGSTIMVGAITWLVASPVGQIWGGFAGAMISLFFPAYLLMRYGRRAYHTWAAFTREAYTSRREAEETKARIDAVEDQVLRADINAQLKRDLTRAIEEKEAAQLKLLESNRLLAAENLRAKAQDKVVEQRVALSRDETPKQLGHEELVKETKEATEVFDKVMGENPDEWEPVADQTDLTTILKAAEKDPTLTIEEVRRRLADPNYVWNL